MSNASRYTKAAAQGVATGVRKEWDRANTLGGVVEYAFLPKEARAIYAATRGAVAATRGVVTGVRAVRSEITSSQLTTLRAVPDAEAEAPKAAPKKHRA